ncbi:Plasmid stabilization system protein ParE [Cyclobacterium lianum]|uniref:Plasmid stabilization system protein ParE n=1 Tax=Cyclobacterium lianum TaxID=388280 RepID=A0A1M7MBE3_9BACT|nr:type II toxin-antitoxin system RelE/ParE family toxin [Cyclobacterium lianum]SHM88118.1 Plasmid stabilization system protein ParE [Cyclobacterium lianum]
MEVRFSEWAKICLKEIYDHYSEEANPEKAAEIVNKIIDRAETLNKYPDRGRVEDDLISLGKGHRYLLEYHYKIIYKVDSEIIIVTDIFSNYQKPARKPKRNK